MPSALDKTGTSILRLFFFGGGGYLDCKFKEIDKQICYQSMEVVLNRKAIQRIKNSRCAFHILLCRLKTIKKPIRLFCQNI